MHGYATYLVHFIRDEDESNARKPKVLSREALSGCFDTGAWRTARGGSLDADPAQVIVKGHAKGTEKLNTL